MTAARQPGTREWAALWTARDLARYDAIERDLFAALPPTAAGARHVLDVARAWLDAPTGQAQRADLGRTLRACNFPIWMLPDDRARSLVGLA